MQRRSDDQDRHRQRDVGRAEIEGDDSDAERDEPRRLRRAEPRRRREAVSGPEDDGHRQRRRRRLGEERRKKGQTLDRTPDDDRIGLYKKFWRN